MRVAQERTSLTTLLMLDQHLSLTESDPGQPYLLAVKAVERHEIWLKTFYRTERWKERAFFERGVMLREHSGLE